MPHPCFLHQSISFYLYGSAPQLAEPFSLYPFPRSLREHPFNFRALCAANVKPRLRGVTVVARGASSYTVAAHYATLMLTHDRRRGFGVPARFFGGEQGAWPL